MKRELRKALEQERERLVQAKIATDKALQAIDTVLKNAGTSMSLKELTSKGTPRKHRVHVFRKRIRKVCEECELPFTAKLNRARFCSNSCRSKHNDNKRVKQVHSKPATLLPGDPLRAAGH